jgi:GTP cyclohydrolase I
MFSRRLQNQERLTTQIADELMEILNPKWVWIIVNAKHLCMMARWIEKQSSNVTTSCLRWLFRSDWNTRGEFLKFLN